MGSLPSIYLIVSVFLTIVVGALIVTLFDTFSLHGSNLGYIFAFNAGSLIFVDLLKIQFRKMIGEEPGETIDSDDLIDAKPRTEAQKTVEKDMRNMVAKESVLNAEDRDHVVEVRQKQGSTLAAFFDVGENYDINGGFVNKKYLVEIPQSEAGAFPLTRRTKQVSSPY